MRPAPVRPAVPAAVVLAALLGATVAAPAQVIRGRVVESGTPLAGAQVGLLDADGARVLTALTGAAGTFVFRPAGPGRYSLVAEMIGRSAATAGPLDVEAGATLDIVLAMDPAPIALSALRVDASQRCRPRPLPGHDTHTVWNEARKALEAESITRASGGYRFDIRQFERVLAADGRRVTRETVRLRRNFGGNPFRSMPAEWLAEHGWAEPMGDGDTRLYGPSAEVLLSDAFLDTHCFHLVRDARARPGQIGLAFGPAPGRMLPDIEGTLWLDETTAELRTLEFRYVRLASPHPGTHGGETSFRRLPEGAWIIDDWVIRTPIAGLARNRFGRETVESQILLGIREEGASVLRIGSVGVRSVAGAAAGTLQGVVWYGEPGRPLPDAAVSLEGTLYTASSGPDGHFHLTDLRDGTYRITWTHVVLADAGFEPDAREVAIRRGETTHVALVLPRSAIHALPPRHAARLDSIAATGRGPGPPWTTPDAEAMPPAGTGRVSGHAVDRDSREPLVGVRITLEAAGHRAETLTDADGRFRIDGVPPDRYRLSAELPGATRQTVATTVGAGRSIEVTLRMARDAATPDPIVTERSPRLEALGFYARRDAAPDGWFLAREDFDGRDDLRLGDLLGTLPGIRVSRQAPDRRSIRLEPDPATRAPLCEPDVFLDGQPVIDNPAHGPGGSRIERIDFLTLRQVEAIEFYQAGRRPRAWPGTCGLLLIWSRPDG